MIIIYPRILQFLVKININNFVFFFRYRSMRQVSIEHEKAQLEQVLPARLR